jgi:hypothetical protein
MRAALRRNRRPKKRSMPPVWDNVAVSPRERCEAGFSLIDPQSRRGIREAAYGQTEARSLRVGVDAQSSRHYPR